MAENYFDRIIPVPQGCSYFLDTTTDQQHIGLITQGCGHCVCIIVRNQDNSKMVLAHVDSGNDITDKKFGLPQWVKQCGSSSNNNNVIVEVHIGCGQTVIRAEDGTNRQEEAAILGFERTIQQLQSKLGFVYNGHDQSQNSKGGMILRNGYRVDFKVIDLKNNT